MVKKLAANTTIDANRKSLVDFVCENAINIVQDPYGNYAVQEIMTLWSEQDFSPLIEKISQKVAQLSIQKFSSNVVEKCLKTSNTEQRNCIIMHIAKVDKLVTVMKNSYGNYVVQTALDLATDEAKVALVDSIYHNIPGLQDKKIRVKWAQLLQNSIANDLNFDGKYDFEEYNQDSLSMGGMDMQLNSSPTSSLGGRSGNGTRKSLSPSKNQMRFESSMYPSQPPMMNSYGYGQGQPPSNAIFFNFDDPNQPNPDFHGYSQFPEEGSNDDGYFY